MAVTVSQKEVFLGQNGHFGTPWRGVRGGDSAPGGTGICGYTGLGGLIGGPWGSQDPPPGGGPRGIFEPK